MKFTRLLPLLALSLLTTVPATAQEGTSRGLLVSVRGGGFSALTDLNDAGTKDTKTGYALGGGLGVQVSKYLVLRGDLTYARDELRSSGVDSGEHLNKYFFGGAVQLQKPFASGFTPYVVAGGGAVSVDLELGKSKTKGQGTFGAGFRYDIPGTRLALFSEGLGYVYKPSNLTGSLAGLDKTQLDLAWTGGISYRFRF